MQRSALCRSRREISNEYELAKFGFDTAESEPCRVRYRPPRAQLAQVFVPLVPLTRENGATEIFPRTQLPWVHVTEATPEYFTADAGEAIYVFLIVILIFG